MRKLIAIAAAAASMLSVSAVAQTGSGASRGEARGNATADRTRQNDDRRANRRANREASRNSSSTYGAGSIYTDRNRAAGNVKAGGTATGRGATSSSSTVDAYGSTNRNGSEAEVYGDLTANAREPN